MEAILRAVPRLCSTSYGRDSLPRGNRDVRLDSEQLSVLLVGSFVSGYHFLYRDPYAPLRSDPALRVRHIAVDQLKVCRRPAALARSEGSISCKLQGGRWFISLELTITRVGYEVL